MLNAHKPCGLVEARQGMALSRDSEVFVEVESFLLGRCRYRRGRRILVRSGTLSYGASFPVVRDVDGRV